MDVLDRITELRLGRNWTEYRLAEEADIPQSTINSWYRRKQEPGLTTIRKLCKAFGITLSQFFQEPEDHEVVVNDLQLDMLHVMEHFSEHQNRYLLRYLEEISKAARSVDQE